jgi:tetratricopeptide (TPR) repeat protein
LKKAEEMITKALEIKPMEPTFLDTYACILAAKKDYLLARFYMEKALEQNINDPVYMEHYGDIIFLMGETDEAVEHWEKAKDMGRDDEILNKKIETRQYYRTNE